MVPAKDFDNYVSELKSNGIYVLDSLTFKDLRSGQKGTGAQQSLLLSGNTNGQEKLASVLETISYTSPHS